MAEFAQTMAPTGIFRKIYEPAEWGYSTCLYSLDTIHSLALRFSKICK